MPRPGLISYALVVRLLTMSIVWLVLLIWYLNAYRIDCLGAGAVLTVLGLFLLAAGVERGFLLRRALFEECTVERDGLFQLFHNRILLALRELLMAVVLGAVLLIAALLFEPRQWSLLFIDLLLLTLLIPRLTRGMEDQVRPRYRYALARQWAMWISVLLLWGEALLVLSLSPPEHFVGMRWQEVVTYGVSLPDVQCPLVGDLAQIFVVGQALAIWAVQNAGRLMNDPTQAVMIWVGFACLVGLTFLVAFAFSRALVGVMARPWEMLAEPPAHAAAEATPLEPTGEAAGHSASPA